jgi:hypothetical protein
VVRVLPGAAAAHSVVQSPGHHFSSTESHR